MKIEIWSDIMCPWCYIGKRRLEQALKHFPEAARIDIEWKSFQLNPELKSDPSRDIPDYLSQKMGVSREQALQMNQHVSQIAAGVGLTYHLDEAVLANTFNAHRLLHFAKSQNKQDAAKERLMRAFFTEGKNIDDPAVLVALGGEIGLDETALRKAIESGAFADDVRADVREAHQLGVRGVPFFVFDRKYGISGAQETAVFQNTLEKAFAQWREAHPEISLEMTEGQACTPDGEC